MFLQPSFNTYKQAHPGLPVVVFLTSLLSVDCTGSIHPKQYLQSEMQSSMQPSSEVVCGLCII